MNIPPHNRFQAQNALWTEQRTGNFDMLVFYLCTYDARSNTLMQIRIMPRKVND